MFHVVIQLPLYIKISHFYRSGSHFSNYIWYKSWKNWEVCLLLRGMWKNGRQIATIENVFQEAQRVDNQTGKGLRGLFNKKKVRRKCRSWVSWQRETCREVTWGEALVNAEECVGCAAAILKWDWLADWLREFQGEWRLEIEVRRPGGWWLERLELAKDANTGEAEKKTGSGWLESKIYASQT